LLNIVSINDLAVKLDLHKAFSEGQINEKIFLVLDLIFWAYLFSGTIFAADITVDDLLNKIQQNIVGMNDFKTNISISTYSSRSFLSKRIEELGYCCSKILIYANQDTASGRENSGVYETNTRR